MTVAEYSRAAFAGPLSSVDIGHDIYAAVTDPNTAFWALVDKARIAESLASDAPLIQSYRGKADEFAREMRALRFELTPSGVYLNPTERCNLNCTYCYLPSQQRSEGNHMPTEKLVASLGKLRAYFRSVMPETRLPRAIFHGAEPLMNKEAVFTAIDEFGSDFAFGIQTNGTLLDDAAIDFLTSRNVSIGLSLDGPMAEITDATRKTWGGKRTQQGTGGHEQAQWLWVLERDHHLYNRELAASDPDGRALSLLRCADLHAQHPAVYVARCAWCQAG